MEQDQPDDLDARIAKAVTYAIESALGPTAGGPGMPGQPSVPMSRRKELLELAVDLCEQIEAAGVRGPELCFLDQCCHTLMQF